MIGSWTAPLAGGSSITEQLVAFDHQRSVRVLVLPAWFDEANKLRRFTLAVMRRLDAAGIDALLPDLPGCNESLAPLPQQTLESWRAAAEAAAQALAATHVLTIRAGALLAPPRLPGWRYAPQSGPKILRGMIRARTIAAREAGREEQADGLLPMGRSEGLVLGGWTIGPELVRALETEEPVPSPVQAGIAQDRLGGPGLWLRAEPGEDAAQAGALAAMIAADVAEPGA